MRTEEEIRKNIEGLKQSADIFKEIQGQDCIFDEGYQQLLGQWKALIWVLNETKESNND